MCHKADSYIFLAERLLMHPLKVILESNHCSKFLATKTIIHILHPLKNSVCNHIFVFLWNNRSMYINHQHLSLHINLYIILQFVRRLSRGTRMCTGMRNTSMLHANTVYHIVSITWVCYLGTMNFTT